MKTADERLAEARRILLQEGEGFFRCAACGHQHDDHPKTLDLYDMLMEVLAPSRPPEVVEGLPILATVPAGAIAYLVSVNGNRLSEPVELKPGASILLAATVADDAPTVEINVGGETFIRQLVGRAIVKGDQVKLNQDLVY